jgi:nucleoside-diphosphate-sugar epimerase
LIVGCGYLGRRVGRQLAGRGETVFVTARNPARVGDLSARGVVPVIVDVLDPASLARLPAVDRVLYCVGFNLTGGGPTPSLYVGAMTNTLEALSGRTGRVVFTSSTGVYDGDDGGWVDEDSPAVPATESGRACLDAERLALGSCAVLGIGCTVVRLSGLYGPGRVPGRKLLTEGEPVPGDPSGFLNLIHVDDAASAAFAALDRGEAGRVYLASDDRPVERREYYTLAAALLGAPGPWFDPPGPEGEGGRRSSSKRVSNRRIKAELGLVLVYPDVKTGLAAAIGEEPSEWPGA